MEGPHRTLRNSRWPTESGISLALCRGPRGPGRRQRGSITAEGGRRPSSAVGRVPGQHQSVTAGGSSQGRCARARTPFSPLRGLHPQVRHALGEVNWNWCETETLSGTGRRLSSHSGQEFLNLHKAVKRFRKRVSTAQRKGEIVGKSSFLSAPTLESWLYHRLWSAVYMSRPVTSQQQWYHLLALSCCFNTTHKLTYM